MSVSNPAPTRVGVGTFDCTPAAGPLFGRLRGIVLVMLHEGCAVVVCAADGVQISHGTARAVADASGIPLEGLTIWSGGPARVPFPVEAAAEALRSAIHQAEPGEWRLGTGPGWYLRAAAADSPLLVGQRLTRSHRQLRNRAPDAVLGKLVERLNGAVAPPGRSWAELLSDQRVMALGAWRADGTALGAVGWWSGTDLYASSGWPTAGARGQAARQWTERISAADHRVPTLVVGPASTGLLGASPRPVSDLRDALRRTARAGDAVSRVLGRLHDDAQVLSWSDIAVAHAERTPSEAAVSAAMMEPAAMPEDAPACAWLLRLGPHTVVSVPGRMSDGLRLRLEETLGRSGVFCLDPSGGAGGTFVTPREDHHRAGGSAGGEAGGIELLETLSELDARAQSVRASGVVGPPSTPTDAPVPTDAPSPHLQVTIRRDSGRGGARPMTHLEARWRLLDAALPLEPGDRWQVRLEWHKDDEVAPVLLRGTPVDDLHQGMRLRVVEGRTGRQMFLRWSVTESRRWVGRSFVLRVGPAYGGPMVSVPVRLK